MHLDDMLMDLEGIEEEAAELQYAIPYRPAVKAAEHIIKYCYEVYPEYYEINPSPYGEVCIEILGDDWGFIVSCDSVGYVSGNLWGDKIEMIEFKYDSHDVGKFLDLLLTTMKGEKYEVSNQETDTQRCRFCN